MSRTKIIRRISFLPRLKGFLPFGGKENLLKPIILHLEELEALRLCSYLELMKEEASRQMGVSRPTLSRIYESAVQKMVLALIESRKLIIEGGRFEIRKDWINCPRCYSSFRKSGEDPERCPLCGTEVVQDQISPTSAIKMKTMNEL